jgi:hypothetical protein
MKIRQSIPLWVGCLNRYFGHDLIIYNAEGHLLSGSPVWVDRPIPELQEDEDVIIVYKDIGVVALYLDMTHLTSKERDICRTLVPFIESQLDDEDA